MQWKNFIGEGDTVYLSEFEERVEMLRKMYLLPFTHGTLWKKKNYRYDDGVVVYDKEEGYVENSFPPDFN